MPAAQLLRRGMNDEVDPLRFSSPMKGIGAAATHGQKARRGPRQKGSTAQAHGRPPERREYIRARDFFKESDMAAEASGLRPQESGLCQGRGLRSSGLRTGQHPARQSRGESL